MAVKIRLARTGKRGHALYRLVAIDEHKKRDGRTVEILGQYDPHKTDDKLMVHRERVDYWLSVGARPTETVRHLLKTATQ
jgi:small subunit ribosomal protein S16